MKRLRFKQDRSLGERLIQEARQAREKADQLPPEKEREALKEKAREDDVAVQIDKWIDSPDLLPPE